jgi:hypothetical protein
MYPTRTAQWRKRGSQPRDGVLPPLVSSKTGCRLCGEAGYLCDFIDLATNILVQNGTEIPFIAHHPAHFFFTQRADAVPHSQDHKSNFIRGLAAFFICCRGGQFPRRWRLFLFYMFGAS